MKRTFIATLLGLAAASLLFAAPAQAQATRTWVSGVGDDANPCSRTAPCKTFPGAISKTAANGEIDVLDPGGFGGVTITKSITIIGVGVEAGVLVSGTNGIIVNDSGAGTINVVLRGLQLMGVGTGLNGIRFISGKSLLVEDCFIEEFNGATPNGYGISFQPSTASQLTVINTTFTNNGVATPAKAGGHVLIQPTAAIAVSASLDHVQMVNGPSYGLRIDTSALAGTTPVKVTMTNSNISNVPIGVAVIGGTGTPPAVLAMMYDTVSDSDKFGITISGASATVRVGSSIISNNATGLSNSGGALTSLGNNLLDGNNVDGTFSGSITPH